MKKRKLIIAILAFIIIEIAFFFYVEYLHKKEITNSLAEKTTETKAKARAVRGSYTIMAETLFKQIIEKPNVLELHSQALDADSITRNEIRDSLYNLLLPTYEQLKLAHIRQLIFILPNNEVFLRFHRPEIFGDDLTDIRYSIKMANQTKQIYSGFEEGRTYNGFRNTFPIYYKGKHIGVIELSFSNAINISFKQDDDVYNHLINKDIANFKLFANQRKNFVQSLLSDEYLYEKEFQHYKKDTANILKQIDKSIKPIIADRLANNENFTILHHINNTDYLITFISIKNVEGNPAAYIVCYHKDKSIIARLSKHFFMMHVIGLLLLAILIFVVLQFSLRRDKLREKEIQEKKILETFKEGIYIVSPDYNITYTNSALQKKTGKDTVGQKCYKAIHNLDKKCDWCIYENLKKEKNAVDYEFETENNKTLISNNILLDDNSMLTILIDITEKKKNEQALKESEEKLKLFMNNFSGCAFIKDNKGKYVFLNKHYETIYGFDIPKLIGKGDEEIWGKEKALKFLDCDNDVRNNKKPILAEDKFQIKGKEYNWLTSKFNLPNGYIAGISFDISKQKEAEKALIESESQLRQIIDLVPHFIFVKDATGKFEIVNKAMAKAFGTTVEDLTGRRDDEFVATEEEKKHFRADDLEVINSGKTKFIPEEVMTDAENNLLYLQTTKVPFKIKVTGKPALLGVAIDITERKHTENALKASEEKYKAVVNNLIDGFYKVDVNGKITLVSPSVTKILGFNEDELIGKAVSSFYANPDEREKFLKEILKTGKVENYSIEFIRKEKSNIFIELNAQVIFKNGESDGIEGVFRDVTERKAIEKTLEEHAQELQERNEDLDAFSHSVAHDLKNPLANIMGFADLLSEDYNNIPEDQAKLFINAIVKSGKKTQEIIHSLLLLASVRKADIKTTKINMGGIVKESLERLSPMILQNNAKITFSKTWPTAIAYSPWIEEVLINYLSNAIKYGGSPPIIDIGYDIVKPENEVRFWVSDNGSGISAKNQTLIFKKFERLDQVKTEGYGLGLSIVERIVEK
ncbi:MAG: PAS domain S-box protein, partial [Bacteroidales bacterium]|nr:PAS domain S-box protein [Bacteroidales bacterium]